jgi:hypothetical protein
LLLGAQLRRFREAAGITPEQAGHEIRASRSRNGRLYRASRRRDMTSRRRDMKGTRE